MSVDDAVEAGARALSESEYGEGPHDSRLADLAVAAAWPILSAPLRAKAQLHAIGAHARGSEEERDWLDLIHLIDWTDKELGL